MRQCQESGGQDLGQGLDPDSQKLNCQNLERLVKSSETGVWENQYDVSLKRIIKTWREKKYIYIFMNIYIYMNI